jgi:hypothetical protein
MWYRKDATTRFDIAAIVGLYFLDGDLASRITQTTWTVDMKFPLIEFPSGVSCEVWDGEVDEQTTVVHLFGELDLLLFSNRDEGFRQAFAIAEQVGYGAKKRGDTQLEVVGYDVDEHLIVTYDNTLEMIVDVRHAAPSTGPARPPLLDEESRAKLPKLYHGEETGLGIDAVAQVKFFSPDAGWTWYASEGSPIDADGYFDTDKEKVDYLFFGLVIGYEIELGFFSLSELMDTRGPFGLSIERDKFYQPKTLRELQEQHRKERRE